MTIYLLSIAVLPVLILAWVVYRQDKYEKEPFSMLLKAFVLGALCIPFAALTEQILSLFTPKMPIVEGIYTGFVVAGGSEEFFKLAMLVLAVWRSHYFNEYFDGIVYACFVALGFACFENISYIFGQNTFLDAMVTGSVRAVLSVPGHFLFGVTMGYYLALAKFASTHRMGYLFLAFFVPMLLHGTFDSLLMIPESMAAGREMVSVMLFCVLVWFDIKMWKWSVRRIHKLQELSEQQDFERKRLFQGFKWDF
ncbi:MAG: PrsW family glutamic-type intramembrane protease [Bacteroidales bacterium]|nr:PrsW family glutamic-type intramembrane protease [Bacteroidales bacterium]